MQEDSPSRSARPIPGLLPLIGLGVLLPVLAGAAFGASQTLLAARGVVEANGYRSLGFERTVYEILVAAADRGVLRGAWIGLLSIPLVLGPLLLLRRLGPRGVTRLAASLVYRPERTLALGLTLALAAAVAMAVSGVRNGGLGRRDLEVFLVLGALSVAIPLLVARPLRSRAGSDGADRAAFGLVLGSFAFLGSGLVLHARLGHVFRHPAAGVGLASISLLAFFGPRLLAARGAGRVALRLVFAAVLLLLAACAASPLLMRVARDREEPRGLAVKRPLNVLVIAVDTLRTDHTSLVASASAERDLTPALRELAARGTNFVNSQSQSPWTMPAFASILTGKYPVEHGALSILGKLRDREVTLAEVLREAGYRTQGIVSHIFVDTEHGFAQGFQGFDESLSSPDGFGIPAPHVTDRALSFLDEQSTAQPFFLFLHYFDPHHMYIDHPEYDDASWYDGWAKNELPMLDLTRCAQLFGETETQYLRDLYDEEIRGTDREIGRLLDGLAEKGFADDTLIVFSADHGEQFMERGYLGHVRNLYQELLRVPLIVVDPETPEPGRVVEEPVETRRAFDEVLGALGVDYLDFGSGGRPVDHTVDPDQPVYATVWLPDGSPWMRFQLASVRSGPWKMVRDYRRGGDLLFRLDTDPGELENLADSQPEELERLGALLDTWILGAIERGELAPAKELSGEERAKLEALGYM